MTIDPQSLTDLRERIALAKDFSPDERTLILDCLNINDYSGQHEYPSRHGPGSTPWATGAWEILDQLKPGKLTRSDRFMVGGMLAGALMKMFEAGREASAGKSAKGLRFESPPNNTPRIEAMWAALSVDDTGEGLCAGPIGRLGVVPLAVTDPKHVALITEVARGIAKLFKKLVRIVKFTAREDLETLQP